MSGLYNKKDILVVGGDKRQVEIVKSLSIANNIFTIGISEDVSNKNVTALKELNEYNGFFSIIILPVPLTNDDVHIKTTTSKKVISIDSVIKKANASTYIFGGLFKKSLIDLLNTKNIIWFDYMEREELVVSNAFLTVQGAINIAVNNIDFSLCNSDILILGGGRIAKILVSVLKAYAANITLVARRKSDLMLAQIQGSKALELNNINSVLDKCDIIFNTIPSMVLNEDRLKLMNKNTLIIDLASAPGGVDFMYAGELGLKCLWELSLPGRIAPKAAGDIIIATMKNILTERGEYLE